VAFDLKSEILSQMKKPMSQFKVSGSGVYLPRTRVSSDGLDERLDRPEGWSEEKSKVRNRYFAEADETFAFMGARALDRALEQARVKAGDLDLLISASASYEQLLPYQAASIHREMGLGGSGIPCFDVGTTCLSFVSALDIASMYLHSGRARRIAIVSSELPSSCMNWDDPETAPLFGDGAAAVILETSNEERGLIASRLETYSDGYDFCRIRAGGCKFNFRKPPPTQEHYMFTMEGRRLFKMVANKMEPFIEKLMNDADMKFEDIDMVVPHQASPLGLYHMQQRLGIPEHKMVNILADHGNQVAASIPIAFNHALKTLKPGSTALLIGTSAGLSLGAALVRV
jgi:3-oxoacyl-[acyl-carrier-protein] synthase-3